MAKGLNEEALKKSAETKKNGIKQVTILDETETHILIDYGAKSIKIYTTKATLMNRLERAGHPFKKEDTIDGKVFARSYEFPTSQIGDFMKVNLFKYD